MQSFLLLRAFTLFVVSTIGKAFLVPTISNVVSETRTTLRMGLLDSISSFLQDREGDFVELEDSESITGPGPLLVLFNLPKDIRIDDEEYMDMISDGAPQAFEKGVILSQISRNDAAILDMSMLDALEKLVIDKGRVDGGNDEVSSADLSSQVALFSGFRNDEMCLNSDALAGRRGHLAIMILNAIVVVKGGERQRAGRVFVSDWRH